MLRRILSQRPRLTETSRVTSAIIFDSSPGRGGLKSAYRAFTAAIPNPVVGLFIGIFLSLLFGYELVLSLLFGKKSFFDALNNALLDPHLLPWTDERTPRLYVFSKNDEMVSWLDVKAHAEKARSLGMKVRTELFETSKHVAHARVDPSRYWGCVNEIWEDATVTK
jgi:hypothetical protein